MGSFVKQKLGDICQKSANEVLYTSFKRPFEPAFASTLSLRSKRLYLRRMAKARRPTQSQPETCGNIEIRFLPNKRGHQASRRKRGDWR